MYIKQGLWSSSRVSSAVGGMFPSPKDSFLTADLSPPCTAKAASGVVSATLSAQVG